jgi:hypothetical protein
VTLPIMTRSAAELNRNISSGNIALDISYYQRIFSLNNSYVLGNFYIDGVNFRERNVDFYNLGEIFQRLGFKLFESNIMLTYYIFSLFYLFLWILFLSQIIKYDNFPVRAKHVLVSSVIIVIFFSNFSPVEGLYPFARIINPQLSIVLWLIGFIVLIKILDSSLNQNQINLYMLFLAYSL